MTSPFSDWVGDDDVTKKTVAEMRSGALQRIMRMRDDWDGKGDIEAETFRAMALMEMNVRTLYVNKRFRNLRVTVEHLVSEDCVLVEAQRRDDGRSVTLRDALVGFPSEHLVAQMMLLNG